MLKSSLGIVALTGFVVLQGSTSAQRASQPSAQTAPGPADIVALGKQSAEENRAANAKIAKQLEDISGKLTGVSEKLIALDRSIWSDIGTGFVQDQFNSAARHLLGQDTQAPPPILLVTLGSFLLLVLKGAQRLASLTRQNSKLAKGLEWLVPKVLWAYLAVLAVGFVVLAVQFSALKPVVAEDRIDGTLRALQLGQERAQSQLLSIETSLTDIKQRLTANRAGVPPTASGSTVSSIEAQGLSAEIARIGQSQPGTAWKVLVMIVSTVAAVASVVAAIATIVIVQNIP